MQLGKQQEYLLVIACVISKFKNISIPLSLLGLDDYLSHHHKLLVKIFTNDEQRRMTSYLG